MDGLKVLVCSKTFWVGLGGVCASVGAAFAGEATWGAAVMAALGFIQVICFRHTVAKEQAKS
jgi:hypothetical protein